MKALIPLLNKDLLKKHLKRTLVSYNFDYKKTKYTDRIEEKIVISNLLRLIPLTLIMIIMQFANVLAEVLPHTETKYCFLYISNSLYILVVMLTYVLVLFYIQNHPTVNIRTQKHIYNSYWFLLMLGLLGFCIIDLTETGFLRNFYILMFLAIFIPVLPLAESVVFALINSTIMIVGIIRLEPDYYLIAQVIVWNIGYIICSQLRFGAFISSKLTKLKLEEVNKDLQEANQRLSDIAEYDELTTLLNRRGAQKRIDQVWLEAMDKHEPVGIIIVDIDYFKCYNDKYGHSEGDQCLHTIAQSLKKCVRRLTDIVARFGGEEFIVVLHGLSEPEIQAIALRIQHSVREENIESGTNEIADYVTISQGVAIANIDDSIRFEDLFKKADEALYLAKKNGRNCVAFQDQILR